MRQPTLKSVDGYVLAWGGSISLAAFAIGGGKVAMGAAVGALIAYVNWLFLRAILSRASVWNDARRLGFAIAIKTMGALGAAAAAVLLLPVSAVGLSFGISALFLGLATYGLRQLPSMASDTDRGA